MPLSPSVARRIPALPASKSPSPGPDAVVSVLMTVTVDRISFGSEDPHWPARTERSGSPRRRLRRLVTARMRMAIATMTSRAMPPMINAVPVAGWLVMALLHMGRRPAASFGEALAAAAVVRVATGAIADSPGDRRVSVAQGSRNLRLRETLGLRENGKLGGAGWRQAPPDTAL